MNISPRLTATASLGLVSAFALSACSSNAAAGDDTETVATIDVGVAPDFFFTHLYFAVEGGFLEEQGIEARLTEYPSGAEAIEAITAGQNDITSATAPTVAATATSGSQAKAIGTNFVGDQWFGLVAAGDYGDVSGAEDLAGATVASQWKISTDMHVRMFLEQNGMSVDDIDYQDVKVAQLITGLSRGDFDAISLWEPNVSKAAAEIPGAAVVPGSLDVFDTTGYLVAGEDIYGDQEVTDRVLTAISNAIEWMDENPEEVLARVMELSSISDEELAQSVQDKVHYEMTPITDAHAEEINRAAQFYISQGVMEEATAEEIAAGYLTEPYAAWESSATSTEG